MGISKDSPNGGEVSLVLAYYLADAFKMQTDFAALGCGRDILLGGI